MGVLDGADRAQRRFRVLGIPIAIAYKFFDDQSNYLAAVITYYAFVAIFPLLLLSTSILGFVLQNNRDLEEQLLDSALGQFPIIGDQLGQPEGLTGSTTVVIVSTLAALYGALGLGQATQNAMNVAWSVPRNSRPNPFLLRLRSLVLLVTAGVAVLVVSGFSIIASSTLVFDSGVDRTLRWLIVIATMVIVGVVFTLLFRLAAARDHSFRAAIPGAFAVAIMWQLLQMAGTAYVTSVLARTSNGMTGTFGLVLGLMGLIYIGAVMALIGIQINVVLARRLWPRALLTPFTDSVDLTDADKRAYTSYARMQRHKGFEVVDVAFGDRPHREPKTPAVPDAPQEQSLATDAASAPELASQDVEGVLAETQPLREVPRD